MFLTVNTLYLHYKVTYYYPLIYSYLNKIKYLCMRNGLPIPYQEEAIKREWGESPRLSRSCELPLLSDANNDATCL